MEEFCETASDTLKKQPKIQNSIPFSSLRLIFTRFYAQYGTTCAQKTAVEMYTHHHYGAQQVETLKVDPISNKQSSNQAGTAFRNASPSLFNPSADGFSFTNLSFDFSLFLFLFFFFASLARCGEINPRFRLVRHHRLGMNVPKAVTVAKWPGWGLSRKVRATATCCDTTLERKNDIK